MFEERCARCRVRGDSVRLFDSIYEGRVCLLCERCAIIENIFIIKKPEQSQLKESEKGITVYDRMKRMAGISDQRKEGVFLRDERLKELERNPNLIMPVKEKPEMREYFHWELMRVRRRRGFSQKHLAEVVGVPEIEIEMLEKAKIPDNIETIKKLENFLNIRLRKQSPFREVEEKKPVLLDEFGEELELIPEPEVEIEGKFEGEDKEMSEENSESYKSVKDFEMRRADLTNVTIGKLKELHKKKIEVTKQEKKEEQIRIEEREKVIEARKEELRSQKEKESRELDNLLGGSELLRSEKKEANFQEDFFDEEADEEVDEEKKE
jgi:ribosome-binding protein aMBF1 (putative translation factor)